MKWLALLMVCIACTRTTETKADEHLAVQDHETVKAVEHSTETVQTGPETITTTVEEYEVVQGSGTEAASSAAGNAGSSAASVLGSSTDGTHKPLVTAPRTAEGSTLPAAAVLIKRTTIVDQRGAVVDTKASASTASSCEDVGLDLTKHAERDTKTTPAFTGWLFWLGIAGAAVVVVGLVAWKFKPPWLTAAVAIFKRV